MTYSTENPTDYVCKFVKVNGQYRWLSVDQLHKTAVEDGEIAESAGTIAIFEDYWKIYDSYSTTLKIGINENTEQEITKILGKRFKSKYD